MDYTFVTFFAKGCKIMPILSALYIVEGELPKEITPQQIQVHLYEFQYKGNLHCSTADCQAKIVYVHKAGLGSYFRTWKYDDHIEKCPHRFHREMGRVGNSAEQILYVEVSSGKKSKALDEAFVLARQSEDEKELIRISKGQKKSPTTNQSENSVTTQLVLFDGLDEAEVIKEGIRAPRIYKRDAKALKDTDIGEVRLVYGAITDVEYGASEAVICLDGGNKLIHVRYAEAFFASNPAYDGLFIHAHRFCSSRRGPIFTGIGELKDRFDGGYDLFIYNGEDFKIENASLLTLAAYYSNGLMD